MSCASLPFLHTAISDRSDQSRWIIGALSWVIALCFVSLAVPTSSIAGLAPVPTELLISAERFDDGNGLEWFFNVELEGSGFTSGTLTPPSGPAITLNLFGTTELEFEEGSFATFGDLQLMHPAGNYLLTLNGTETVTVNWNPTEPQGAAGQASMVLTTPGADAYQTNPDITYVLDCTNCDNLGADMFDVATDGATVSFDFQALNQTPPASVPFSSLVSENMLTELPLVDMEVEIASGLLNQSNVTLSPSGVMFQYEEGAFVGDFQAFGVHSLDVVRLEAAREDQGAGLQWFFFAEANGGALNSITVTPPIGSPVVLTDPAMMGEEFDFESNGFSSLGNLNAVFPAGTYTVTVDGTQTSSLFWDPTIPAGAAGDPSLSITSPASMETGVSSTPDVTYALDCTNCSDLDIEIFDLLTDGATALFSTSASAPPALPNPILFSSLISENMLTELPDGDVVIDMLVGLSAFDTGTLSPSGGGFDYEEVGSLLAMSTFQVPEPSATFASLAALATVGSVVRLRRRSRESRV